MQMVINISTSLHQKVLTWGREKLFGKAMQESYKNNAKDIYN